MFGGAASELVREVKNSRWLLPFNESSVRNVVRETQSIVDALVSTVAESRDSMDQKEVLASIFLFHRSVQRNKRCVLAYLYNRIERIKSMRWECSSLKLASAEDSVSTQEGEFLAGYNQLLGEYCEKVGLDLTAELQPPKDLYIEVRVLEDCGSVMTDHGTINLKTGTAHYVARADVEHLVRQGSLEHVI